MSEDDTARHLTRTSFEKVRAEVYLELQRAFLDLSLEEFTLKKNRKAQSIVVGHGWTIDEFLKRDEEYAADSFVQLLKLVE